jgi:hypothetical protein
MLEAAHASANAGKSEEEELAELQGMIGGVPRGMYIKLQQAQKNRDLADQVRKDKEELKVLQERRAAEQKDRMDRLREKRESKHEAAKAAHKAKIDAIGAQVREEVRELEATRDANKAAFWRDARVRVEVANGLDAKLDAAEAAQDQRERDEAAAARAELKRKDEAAKQLAAVCRPHITRAAPRPHARARAYVAARAEKP